MQSELQKGAAESRGKEIGEKGKGLAHDVKARLEAGGSHVLRGSDAGANLGMKSAEDQVKATGEEARGTAHGQAAGIKEKIAEGMASVKEKIAGA